MDLIIGTRGSKLALAQAAWVRERLDGAGHAAEICVLATSGDKLVSLAAPGVKGLFIKEIEEALLDGRINLAVHSMKDVPVDQPDGLSIAAVPAREDPRDALLTRSGAALSGLPAGSRIGTSSLRRESQLRSLRPDLIVIPMRGNVDTRIAKMMRGECDALVVAAAGLRRLGLAQPVAEYFEPEHLCPAPGQGALAIEVRRGDSRAAAAAKLLDDPWAHCTVRAERAVLRALGGGCRTPIGAFAVMAGERLKITAMVAAPDGSRIVRSHTEASASDPDAAGASLAEDLLRLGARIVDF
ncbi:MAG: hydroxymethylbilane synthase [Terriglobia bacterium]